MRVRWALAMLAAAAVLAAPAAAATPQIRILGFSGHRGQGANPPADAVRSGGTWGSCRVSDLKALYVFVTYSGLRKGVPIAVRWLFAGRPVFTDRFKWDGGASGRDYYYVNKNGGKDELEDGRWGVEVRVSGKLLARGSVTRVTQYC